LHCDSLSFSFLKYYSFAVKRGKKMFYFDKETFTNPHVRVGVQFCQSFQIIEAEFNDFSFAVSSISILFLFTA